MKSEAISQGVSQNGAHSRAEIGPRGLCRQGVRPFAFVDRLAQFQGEGDAENGAAQEDDEMRKNARGESRPEQKAIIVSGYARSERARLALELGALGFLRKPLTMKSLALAIRKALDSVPSESVSSPNMTS